jgi:hypothetical protein
MARSFFLFILLILLRQISVDLLSILCYNNINIINYNLQRVSRMREIGDKG